MMNQRGLAAVAALGLALLGSPTLASAQYGPPPPPPGGGYGPPPPQTLPGGFPNRLGFTIGGGLGGGSMSFDCPDCGEERYEAVMGEVHAGGMLNPQMAILFDVFVLARPEDTAIGPATFSHGIVTGAFRYWATPMLWVQGGVGLSQLRLEFQDFDTYSQSDSVFGVMGAVGFEVLHAPTFALDVYLRLGSGFYEDGTATNAALGISANWYMAQR